MTFYGRGWGHGVGMCQVGAYGMALDGATLRRNPEEVLQRNRTEKAVLRFNFELRIANLQFPKFAIRNSKFEISPCIQSSQLSDRRPAANPNSALHLAEHLSGEIVNYDSVQIVRRLNIGPAKPTPQEQQRAPHHMIDLREPTDVFTAGDYQREARRVLEEIRERRKLPILVGGTGLYLRALVDGLFNGPGRSFTGGIVWK